MAIAETSHHDVILFIQALIRKQLIDFQTYEEY